MDPALGTPEYFDCQSCGACCASPFDGEGYIPLQEAEAAALGRLGLPVLEVLPPPAEDQVVLLGTRLNTQRQRVCAAFFGKIGGRCACVVHAQRPSVCREFAAGSPECLQARHVKSVTTFFLEKGS